MGLKTFTKSILCGTLLAVGVLNVNAQGKLYIIGPATEAGWNPGKSVSMLSDAGDANVFKATVYLKANEEFKFLTEPEFTKIEYRAKSADDVEVTPGVAKDITAVQGDAEDYKFHVTESGNYDISCDLGTNVMLINKSAYQDTNVNYAALWLIGNACDAGWDLGKAPIMPQDPSKPYVYSGVYNLKEGELKFTISPNAGFDDSAYYFSSPNDPGKMEFGTAGDHKWNITEAGPYRITANVADMTISFVKDPSAGISSVETGKDAPAEYFTLSGVKVTNPTAGVYVKRQGGKTVKVVLK